MSEQTPTADETEGTPLTFNDAGTTHRRMEHLAEFFERHPNAQTFAIMNPAFIAEDIRTLLATPTPAPDAVAEGLREAMENDPFVDDIPLMGTTQQSQRIAHYASVVLAALPASQSVENCTYCDGTGDVHRQDGEWLGPCPEGHKAPASQPVADVGGRGSDNGQG